MIKEIDEKAVENSNKPKLMAALLGRVSYDDVILDALNIHKMAKPDEPEKKEGGDGDEEGGDEENEDFDFGM